MMSSGIAGDGLRDAESLAHAAGVVLDLSLRRVREVHALEQRRGERARLLPARDALELQQVLEHRFAGEVREEPEVLRQVAEHRPERVRLGEDVASVECDGAGGRLEHAGEDAHEGGLAGAVGAEETEHPGADVERDALERGHGAGINLHEIADTKHGCRGKRMHQFIRRAMSTTAAGRWVLVLVAG